MSAITNVREVITGRPSGVTRIELYRLAGIYGPDEIDKALAQLVQSAQVVVMPGTTPLKYHLSVSGNQTTASDKPIVRRTVLHEQQKTIKQEVKAPESAVNDKRRGRMRPDSLNGRIALFLLNKPAGATAKEIVAAVTDGGGNSTQIVYNALSYLSLGNNGYIKAAGIRPRIYSWSGKYSHPFAHDVEQSETKPAITETTPPEIETPAAVIAPQSITDQLDAMEQREVNNLRRVVSALIADYNDANFHELVKVDARLLGISQMRENLTGEPA